MHNKVLSLLLHFSFPFSHVSLTAHPSSCPPFCLSSFNLSVSLFCVSVRLRRCGVSGSGATLSDSNCTDVNDILLMLSATSDTGARRGHSATQTQGWSQTVEQLNNGVGLAAGRDDFQSVAGEEKKDEDRRRETITACLMYTFTHFVTFKLKILVMLFYCFASFCVQ